MDKHLLLEEAKRLKAVADVGLLYCANEYDKERYAEIRNTALNIIGNCLGSDADDLKLAYPVEKDYPTAKVDIRGMLLSEQKILLVKESADGKWSLPGGWADVGIAQRK